MPLRPTVALAILLLALGACSRKSAETDAEAEQPLPYDSLSPEEEQEFALDPTRFPEMEGGALDTVNLTARADDAAWQVQVLNYTPNHIAMTYAAWYTGFDSLALFAYDRQPYLLDDRGNRYEGVVTPNNPRIKVESGTTAVGVYVFDGGVAADADSLSLYVNDSTPPVIRAGPWAVPPDARRAPGPGQGPRRPAGSGP